MTNSSKESIDSEEANDEKLSSQQSFKRIFLNLKFLLIPAYRIKSLNFRDREYERTVSKRRTIYRLINPLTIIGLVIVFIVTTLAVFPEWISPYAYEEANLYVGNIWSPPSSEHPLGQTYGRDILARIIFGAKSALIIAFPSVIFSVIFGLLFGVIAAYYGKWFGSIIMRIGDILLAFPGLILAMIVLQIIGRNFWNIILVYGIIGIPIYARLIRGSVLQAKSLPYIDAARVVGARNWRIMFKHILPNCSQPIIINLTFDIGGIILSLAALSFLGYSDQSLIQWGTDIGDARYHFIDAPWASVWPGIMIIITVVGFLLLGDGLRDTFDPKLRNL